MEKAVKRRSGTETRRRTEIIMVRVTREEQARLQDLARDCGLRMPAYLRQVGLGYEPRSRIDQQTIRDLAQLHGDLGRVGGLLKLWLSRSERQGFGRHLNIPQAVAELRELQRRVYQTLEKL